MAHVFISYSHKDKEYARLLAGELKKHGIEFWMDDRIDYGTQWPRVIQENIETSGAVIVIMSTHAYNSDWVQNEVAFAQGEGKTFFPILLEGKAWVSLASAQYADVRDGNPPPRSFFEQLAPQPGHSKLPLPAPQGDTSHSQTSKRVEELKMHLRNLRESKPQLSRATKEILGIEPLVGENVITTGPATRLISPLLSVFGKPDINASGLLILTDQRLIFKADIHRYSFSFRTYQDDITHLFISTAFPVKDGYNITFGIPSQSITIWLPEDELFNTLKKRLPISITRFE